MFLHYFHRVKLFFVFVLCLIVGGIIFAENDNFVELPKITEYVYDATNTLSQSEKIKLQAVLTQFEKKHGSQMLVVLLPTTQPETIEEYSIRLAESLQVGRKQIDDGVILLVAKNDRKLRIEVGYGLEGVLPDITCKEIIDTYITPLFRRGNFAEGIAVGIGAIAKKISTGELPPPTTKRSVSLNIPREKLGMFFVLLVVAFFLLTKVLGKKLGGILSFGASGILGQVLFQSFLVGFGIVIALGFLLGMSFLLMLGNSYVASPYGHYHGHHRSRNRWGSGGFGGGGFSGGGGSFGGGGASGGW